MSVSKTIPVHNSGAAKPNFPADPSYGPSPPTNLVSARQQAADSIQKLRYTGGQARADAQKSGFNHR